MDISTLTRDAKVIHQDLVSDGDQALVTKAGCSMYLPASYQDQSLVKIGSETYVIGLFALVVGKQYGVSKAPTMLRIAPDNIRTVKIQDEDYLEFTFEPGSVVIANVNAVQDNQLLYVIYNEFIAKGNVPWYFNYQDMGELFTLSKRYTGSKLGANRVITELIVATIARNPENLNQQYRQSIDNLQALTKTPPKFIKLNSVTYGATNTTAKLIGAYWDEGLNSALVNPTEKQEPIETLLRK